MPAQSLRFAPSIAQPIATTAVRTGAATATESVSGP